MAFVQLNASSAGAQDRKVCFLLEGAGSEILSAAHRNGRTRVQEQQNGTQDERLAKKARNHPAVLSAWEAGILSPLKVVS